MSEWWRQGWWVRKWRERLMFVVIRLLSDGVKDQLLVTIQKTFNYSRGQAQQIFLMVMECMKKRALVSNDVLRVSVSMSSSRSQV